jgi:hypothetical protein
VGACKREIFAGHKRIAKKFNFSLKDTADQARKTKTELFSVIETYGTLVFISIPTQLLLFNITISPPYCSSDLPLYKNFIRKVHAPNDI